MHLGVHHTRDGRGKDGVCFVVVHQEKTYVAIKQHEGEVACAVVVDDTGVFVGKGAKAEHVGDGLIVDIINEGGTGLVAAVLVVVIRNKAQHNRLMDAWGTGRVWKEGMGWFGCCAAQVFVWPFNVAFQCCGAWHKIFLDGLGIEVLGTAEEASTDGFD